MEKRSQSSIIVASLIMCFSFGMAILLFHDGCFVAAINYLNTRILSDDFSLKYCNKEQIIKMSHEILFISRYIFFATTVVDRIQWMRMNYTYTQRVNERQSNELKRLSSHNCKWELKIISWSINIKWNAAQAKRINSKEPAVAVGDFCDLFDVFLRIFALFSRKISMPKRCTLHIHLRHISIYINIKTPKPKQLDWIFTRDNFARNHILHQSFIRAHTNWCGTKKRKAKQTFLFGIKVQIATLIQTIQNLLLGKTLI